MRRTVEMELEYLPYLEKMPISSKQLHKQAASSDETTVASWKDQWISQMQQNHKTHGPWKDNCIGQLFGQFHLQPGIIAGSGPSLKHNAKALKERGSIPLISCLHNFQFFEDQNIEPNYYVTLDAGEITLEEISEGGKLSHEEYVERTAKHTLIAFVSTHPKLIDAWKGKIIWYNAPIPDLEIQKAFKDVERFDHLVSTGGNVLGSAVYVAKAYFGCNPIAFIGADFCFDYTKKFHAWDSKYDKNLGQVIRLVDCFGNKVYTWQSYYNFKCFFESVAMRCPGQWINCSEGGTLGVSPNPAGLMPTFKHMPLDDFIKGYNVYQAMKYQARHPENADEDPGVEGIPPQPKILY